MHNQLVQFLLVVAVTSFLSLISFSSSAAEYPMAKKLQQCEAAFKTMRSENITREEAAKAREEHIKLMVEILQNLNNQNVAAVDQDRPLTPEELSNNVRVMGHLIEMLAVDHMAPKYDWSYVY